MDTISKQKNTAAFFDLDLTLTNTDSFRLFLKTYYFSRFSRMIFIPHVFVAGVLRKLRLISLKKFKESALIGLKGKSIEDIRQLGGLFFEKHLKKTLREKAFERLKEHSINGDTVYIVSASPDIYVHAACRYLNCDGYICTTLDYCSTIFSGRIRGNDCIGREKKTRIMKLAKKLSLNLKTSWAYSDHEVDIPFFETVGNKVAVTPTLELLQIAGSRNWGIEEW